MDLEFKKISEADYSQLIEFDTRYMILESPLTQDSAPPPLKIEEIVTAKNRRDDLFWIWSNEELVGYYWLEYREDCLFLSAIVVASSFRNKKIGHTIMKLMDDICDKRGIKKSALAVSPDNHPALFLYMKHGYEKKRLRENYFGPSYPGKNRFWFEKLH